MKKKEFSLPRLLVTGENNVFSVKTSWDRESEEVQYLRIGIEGNKAFKPPVIKITLIYPSISLFGLWRAAGNDMEDGYNRTLAVNWEDDGKKISNTLSAPVIALYDVSGDNRLTLAYSDLLEPIFLKAGIQEDSVELHVTLTLFQDSTLRFDKYQQIIRLDTRAIPYYKTLFDVSAWWERASGIVYSRVPENSRRPMYSTWYSFHQNLSEEAIEVQSALAKDYGCDTIIVDDGWHMSGTDNSYHHTGDWEIAVDKFGNMKEHVKKVHEIGLNYMIWYSVPFIGIKSKQWNRFQDKILDIWESKGAGILDPRFPEVRDYILGRYKQAIQEWDIDGLKLDFVDYFNVNKTTPIAYGNGRDYDDVQAAVDCLMSTIMQELRDLKQDIMIEFRQPYSGPLMRKYGNMLRAWDCVNDALENRIRTIDLRLISGNSAVHSDMIIWHKEDLVECAALQLLNAMFSVIQISVLLEQLPNVHQKMLKFWLNIFKEQEEVLQLGELKPHSPQQLYPYVIAETREKLVVTFYDDMVVPLDFKDTELILIVNAKLTDEVFVDLKKEGRFKTNTYSCTGDLLVSVECHEYHTGLQRFQVPASGLIKMMRSSDAIE